ncbi:uncharacterized protein RHIMIDRAFT_237183 [Rhizopus microsporus ATCC 52813]|uniref:Uncharacterized protein n=2 Tax=Rhizopus microsporus TaxID=58291 RepID=A0A2G4SWJ8_RHIZD|nr:uncharacterized protein RHIMIDRAFT_237183 [Rhizopus microsporus ATCC 52813]PHZ13163.1 hypothetical protein RHIMIDRAFT_237183 [Rhizopus microsporus ATCC 52813]
MNIVKKTTVKLDDIHIVGYNINSKYFHKKKWPFKFDKSMLTAFIQLEDEEIRLMDMDSPMGYVTRIRRLNEIPYPSSSDDYITCMIPLLQLAALGKVIMEDTLHIIHHTPRSLTVSNYPSARPVLPSCFLPSSLASSSKKPKN